MLIAVVTIFATLWLPHRGMLVYNTVAALVNLPRYMDLWFLMFAKTCIYINRLDKRREILELPIICYSAINPILYNALSEKFRRAFRRTLCCKAYYAFDSAYNYPTGSSMPLNHLRENSSRMYPINSSRLNMTSYSEMNGTSPVTMSSTNLKSSKINSSETNGTEMEKKPC